LCVLFFWSPLFSTIIARSRDKQEGTQCWDVRNPSAPVYTLQRKSSTSQRIDFDFTPDGRFLVTGSQDGAVLVFGMDSGQLVQRLQPETHNCEAVNGVSVHPWLPLVATGTGQRKYMPLAIDSDSDSDSAAHATAPPPPQRNPPAEAMLRIFRVPHTAAAASQ